MSKGLRDLNKDAPVRLPIWAITLLVGILLSTLSVVFTAGVTYGALTSLRERFDAMEQRMERIEQRLFK